MDFRLDDEHELFRRSVREFVLHEVVPVRERIEEDRGAFRELFGKTARMGYLGVRYPSGYGGSGGDFQMFCLMCEELARGSLSLAACVAMQSLMGTEFIFRYGSEDQRERLVVPAIRGEMVGAFSLTEPNAGSDLGAISTTAVRDGNEYVLNGSKTWVTNGPIADFFTIAASTDREKGIRGLNLFLVEKGTPGLQVGKHIEKLGLKGSLTSELHLSECRVPAGNLLGEPGKGAEQLMGILAEIRTMTGALSVGLAQAALDDSMEYAGTRVQFGRPIGKFQAIQQKIAEMGVRIEASRLLVYKAAWMIDNDIRCMREASIAKLFASESANWIADEACRVFAGYGFSMESNVQRYLRDARFLLIGGGTSEILRGIIFKEMG